MSNITQWHVSHFKCHLSHIENISSSHGYWIQKKRLDEREIIFIHFLLWYLQVKKKTGLNVEQLEEVKRVVYHVLKSLNQLVYVLHLFFIFIQWFSLNRPLGQFSIQVATSVCVCDVCPLRWQQEPRELEISGQRAYRKNCKTKNHFYFEGFNHL